MFAVFGLVALALAASQDGVVRRGVEVPNAISKQHNAYVRCQDDHFDVRNAHDGPSFAAEVEKAIAACKDQKIVLAAEAGRILASAADYQDPAKRQSAIYEAFDGYDEMRRVMARAGSPN